MEKKNIFRLTAYGLLAVLFLCYFLALVTQSARWSLFLVSISPFLICFFVYTVLRYEKPSRKEFKDGSWYEKR
jgi:FtsH-binding integral membrane protein